MSDQVQQISRALQNDDFHDALSYLGLGDNCSLKFSSRGPPEIPAFSPRKPRSSYIPPTRPKIYGPPPYPAFQRRNSQTAAAAMAADHPDRLKDPAMFLNFSSMIPRLSSCSDCYPVLDPSRFYPTILIASRTSSIFPPSDDNNNNNDDDDVFKEDQDEDEPIASGDDDDDDDEEEATTQDSEEVLCPFCSTCDENNNVENKLVVTETKQLVFEVLKAVSSESSGTSQFADLSPKEVYSATDVRSAAILSSSCDDVTTEEKHLSVMFSTDTFHESSASSTQELRDEEMELEHNGDDAGLPLCGPMSDTVLLSDARLMTLS